jgi:hypothetical protein
LRPVELIEVLRRLARTSFPERMTDAESDYRERQTTSKRPTNSETAAQTCKGSEAAASVLAARALVEIGVNREASARVETQRESEHEEEREER